MNSNHLTAIDDVISATQVQEHMKKKKEDFGLFKGLAVAIYLYWLGWIFYQWSYSKGAEAKSCPAQGYVFDKALTAFPGAK